MATNKITTLSEFLKQSGAKYRIFDMGRRVNKVSADVFFEFEKAIKPYPQPMKKKALFGIIFWDPKQEDQQYIWFLSFPLDEQGLLIQAARDEFLVMLLDHLGECILAAENGQNIDGALKDSPYTFKPKEDKMAAFNAQATQALAKPASQYYRQAYDYFTAQTDSNNWSTLAMQGVADVAIRSHDEAAIINELNKIAEPTLISLAGFLEHVETTPQLVEAMAQQLDAELQQATPNINRICAYLRAVSNSTAQGLVAEMVDKVLQQPCSSNIEILATISGRCWTVLAQETRCHRYLEQLAHNDAGQAGFSHLLADLLFIPTMRTPVMQTLRQPERSEQLSRAIGEMFG